MSYWGYLGYTILAVLVLGGIAAPLAVPLILVYNCHFSALWFLLLLLYIPEIAFFVYVGEEY